MKLQIVIYSFLLGLLLVGVACSSLKDGQAVQPDDIVIYPAPPDTTRIQYLGSISGSQHIQQKRSAFVRYTLGEEKAKSINKPYGVNMHSGKIYVCDAFIKGIEIIDLENHRFDYFIPGGKGELKLPFNSVIGDNGYLYVADGGRGQVVVFDENRKYVSCFGKPEEMKPIDLVIYDNKIWVPNMLNHKVEVYDKNTYELLQSFPDGEEGSVDYLFSPTNIDVYNGKVYITDVGDFKIKVFDTSGKYLYNIGQYGNTIGSLTRPKGIAVDRDENVYVVDAVFENVQIFNKKAGLLMFFGGEYKGPGGMWLPADVSVNYDNMKYFDKFVDPGFKPVYIIFVTNQYGPDKLSIYAFVEPADTETVNANGEKKVKTKRRRKKTAASF